MHINILLSVLTNLYDPKSKVFTQIAMHQIFDSSEIISHMVLFMNILLVVSKYFTIISSLTFLTIFAGFYRDFIQC